MDKNRYTTYYAFIFILVSIAINTSAQQGANKIEYPSLGISFEVPETWVGQDIENGFLISSPNVPGFMLLTTHDLKTNKAIAQELTQDFTIGPNSRLTPTGSLEVIDTNTFGNIFTGLISGNSAKAYILGLLNPYGVGLTVICGSNVDLYSNELKEAGLSLAKSVSFYDLKTQSEKNLRERESNKWEKKFSNCRLTAITSHSSYGTGGYGKKITIDLCGKGYFNHSSYSSMSVSGGDYNGGYGDSSQGSGTWKILEKGEKVILQLQFYNGKVNEYIITIDQEDKTFLNGNRYFRTYDGAGKYSPKCN